MITRNKKLLAVEVTGDGIRAALVCKTGKTFEVADFAAIPRPDLNDDLPPVAAIKALAERLQHRGGGVVFVSPMARTFDLLMDRIKIKGLKKPQMLEAVKWEVEPYTGINGSNALISVERVRSPAPEAGDVQPDDEDAPVTVSVSAMESNVYRALKARFKVAGFKLLRVYPPDVTFYMPLLLQTEEVPRALLDVGQDYSNFAVLRGRLAEQISTLSLSLESLNAHLGGEDVSAELEDSLRFTARQAPSPEPLVVAGAGAAVPAVVDYIAGFCPQGAVPLSLSRSAGIADAKDDPANAVFATVVGAAMRELLGPTEQALGLSDAEDMG